MRAALFGLVLLLAGCGGGGGGVAVKSVPSVLASRQAALMQAFQAGDAAAYMGFIAETYADDYGLTKATLGQAVAMDFSQFDTLALSLTSQKFEMAPDSTHVKLTAVYRITDHDKVLNDTQTYSFTSIAVWSRFGTTWLITKLIKPANVQSLRRRFL